LTYSKEHKFTGKLWRNKIIFNASEQHIFCE